MLWPETTVRRNTGELVVGGVPLPALATEYGTPLYIFDAETLRRRADVVLAAVRRAPGPASAVFAAKALSLPSILALFHQSGLGIDVVSGGELFAAFRAGVPPSSIAFHGNNKSEEELRGAMNAGVHLIAVDNFHELDLLEGLAGSLDNPQEVLIRLNPGIDVHTHGKIATGVMDSKFGFPLWTEDASAAVERAMSIDGLSIAGYHIHLGSQLFDIDAPVLGARLVMEFAAEMEGRWGVKPGIVSPGGGMGIAYGEGSRRVDIAEWVNRTVGSIHQECDRHGLAVPTVIFEPGRYLVGQAGVALYEVGSTKVIPGIRTYVSVDGGMADNIRPSLYGAEYTASLANRKADEGSEEQVTIAGKYCESGDVLIRDISLPRLELGDLIAVPAAGAYCIPLASNYNMAPRPAVVMVDGGNATLIRRRETFDDLLATTVI